MGIIVSKLCSDSVNNEKINTIDSFKSTLTDFVAEKLTSVCSVFASGSDNIL